MSWNGATGLVQPPGVASGDLASRDSAALCREGVPRPSPGGPVRPAVPEALARRLRLVGNQREPWRPPQPSRLGVLGEHPPLRPAY